MEERDGVDREASGDSCLQAEPEAGGEILSGAWQQGLAYRIVQPPLWFHMHELKIVKNKTKTVPSVQTSVPVVHS